MDSRAQKILGASKQHPIVPLPDNKEYTYGTAGFRMKADLLEGITFRVGLLAALRSRKLNGQAIGVMITASHNPAADNGVKVVDPMGEMLEQDWETHATTLVNCPSDEILAETYVKLAQKLKIDLGTPAKVIYGRDTRPSGHKLVGALAAALDAADSEHVDFKILTTPQLHYLVRCTNTEGTPKSYGKVSELGYYEKLSKAFKDALMFKKPQGTLQVDCANGVGGPKLAELRKELKRTSEGENPRRADPLDIKIVNDDVLRPEVLNLDSGADFVKTKQRAPPSPAPTPGLRCCSLDGDADRIIYYWVDPDTGFTMLDGDRISSLCASFIGDLVRAAGIEEDLRIGVVQTAYANGASTHYITQHLRLPVVCTPTGVKHLHHAACNFDIGVYFEANGHGTIVFSSDAMELLKKKTPESPAQKEALETLAACADLINQTVGDALSDMLMVEVVLTHKNWTLRDWAMTYTDLPNRLVKVEVRDKDAFKTTDAERRLSHPPGAQDEIDSVVSKYKSARAFARASGTENVCRVYAEAATKTEAEELANRVKAIIARYGGATI